MLSVQIGAVHLTMCVFSVSKKMRGIERPLRKRSGGAFLGRGAGADCSLNLCSRREEQKELQQRPSSPPLTSRAYLGS